MKNELTELIDATARQLTEEAPGKNGLIRKIFLIPQKKWYELYKPDDFGDHTLFIAAAGQSEFAKKQYLLWKARFLDGFPFTKHRLPLPPLLEARNMDDFLHGLYGCAVVLNDDFFLQEGTAMAERIKNIMQDKAGFISSVRVPFLHIPLPEGFSPLKPTLERPFFANASSNGSIAEKLILIGQRAGRADLIAAGRKCLDAWISTKTFQENGIFPDRTQPSDEPKSALMKTNSNFGFALVASTKSPGGERHAKILKQLLETLPKTHGCENGMANGVNGSRSLIATQAYGRLLLDAAPILGIAYQEKAELLAEIVAETLLEDPSWNLVEDDGEGDMAVFLMIADPTRKLAPLLAKLFDDMKKKFYLGNGLWRDYCVDSMQQTAHSKYLGGVLKYLLTYRAYLTGEDLSKGIWPVLTQDR